MIASCLLALDVLSNPALAKSTDAAVHNANHVFNAVHSSMRQWGGSLNHNGMSFFLAKVPEGTHLYHGTSHESFVKGMEWLAFEPEHALIFARPRRAPGRPPSETAEGPLSLEDETLSKESSLQEEKAWRHHGSTSGNGHDEAECLPSFHHDRHDANLPSDMESTQPQERSTRIRRKPCVSSERSFLSHHEGGRNLREHGPPPPLPPGHIYRPYPPPPRKLRPEPGFQRPWSPVHRGPPSPPPPSNYYDVPTEHHDIPAAARRTYEFASKSVQSRKPQAQKPLRVVPALHDSSAQQSEEVGYLHTYAPTHALQLLYIDGLSAGKTDNGTLDTQDKLLLNMTDNGHGGPMGGEMARAKGLCELAATLWESKIDGILRMEGGFEVILCDFEKHLERIDVVRSGDAVGEPNQEGRPTRGVMGGWEYVKAITSRYHGLGGDRVDIDYNSFVSVFAHNVKGLWDNDVQSDTRMPRLTNVDPAVLHAIRDEVTSLILNADWTTHAHGRNWQVVTDLVVARYSAPLQYIAATTRLRDDRIALTEYLHRLLRPFIDVPSRNVTLETARCVAQFVPSLPTSHTPPASLPPLAHRTIHAVTARICDALLTAHSIAVAPVSHSSYSHVYAVHAVEIIQELVDWLGWTSWKDCGTCGDEEVCFVPIWPMGAREDHEKPRCRGEKEVAGQMGYWGRMEPPRGKGRGHGGNEGVNR